MILKLLLKISLPLRMVFDLLCLAFLALLFLPLAGLLNPLDLGVYSKTLLPQLLHNLGLSLTMGIVFSFSGFVLAFILQMRWPGKWIFLGALSLFLFLPEPMQIMVSGPVVSLFSSKITPLFSVLSLGAWCLAVSIIFGLALIRSIPSDQRLALQQLGASPVFELVFHCFPRFAKPLGWNGLFLGVMCLGHGSTLSGSYSHLNYSLSYLFIGPMEMFSLSSPSVVAYASVLALSLPLSLLFVQSMNSGANDFVATPGTSAKKRVRRKASPKRKPRPNQVKAEPTVANPEPTVETSVAPAIEPEVEPAAEVIPEPESAPPMPETTPDADTDKAKKPKIKLSFGKK